MSCVHPKLVGPCPFFRELSPTSHFYQNTVALNMATVFQFPCMTLFKSHVSSYSNVVESQYFMWSLPTVLLAFDSVLTNIFLQPYALWRAYFAAFSKPLQPLISSTNVTFLKINNNSLENLWSNPSLLVLSLPHSSTITMVRSSKSLY